MASKATIDELAAMVNKAVGTGSVRKGSDPSLKVEYIPTGLLPFDVLLQGGLPRGRFATIQGDWSTLKSYVGLSAARETQRLGGIAAIMDTEHAFDPSWARELGVNEAELLVIQPDNGEEAIDIAEGFIRSRKVDLICFDSVAATLPQAEQDKRMYKENIQPGRQAALMSAACRRLTAAQKNQTAVLWVNQMRENVGMSFGPREKAAGGRALPYYSSYIIETRKVGKITRDVKAFHGEKGWQGQKEQVGQHFKAELLKSKLNKPFRDVFFDWDMSTGSIDELGFVISASVESGRINIKGNTWTYGNLKAVGRTNFRKKMEGSLEAQQALTEALRESQGLPVPKRKAATPVRAPKKMLRKV